MIQVRCEDFLGRSFTDGSSICFLTHCVIHAADFCLMQPRLLGVNALWMHLDFLGLLQLGWHILDKLLEFYLLWPSNLEFLLGMVWVFSVIVMAHLFIEAHVNLLGRAVQITGTPLLLLSELFQCWLTHIHRLVYHLYLYAFKWFTFSLFDVDLERLS